MANITAPISLDVRTQKPLEYKRGPVMSKSDLINSETWSYDVDNNGNKIFYVYPGMIVPVITSREIYMLIDPSKIIEEDYSGWSIISGSGGDMIYDGGNALSRYIKEQVLDSGNAQHEIKG